jgi:cytochrome P450
MLPPGSPAPSFWQTYRFITRPEEYTREIQGRYGDVVRIKTLLGNGVAVFEPGLAREVFAAPPEAFEAVSLVEALFGSTAVIAVAGEKHKKLRKLLNPHFHGAQVKGFLAAMRRAVRASFDVLERAAQQRGEVAMTEVAQTVALDVILETVFGAGKLDRDEARGVLRHVIHSFTPSIVGGETLHKPWFPPWRRYVRARQAFDRWVSRVAGERRASSDGSGEDVLGVLLSTRYEDGDPMTDAELRDQLFTLLLAGHETSAIAMAWCVHNLLRAPEALARLRREIEGLGPDPSPEGVAKLPFLEAVVLETLRIAPIVTDVSRLCREPLTLGQRWTVPRGEVVVVMIASILRDRRVYPAPEQFRPERFLDKRYASSEFVPFGGGARRCLGAAFAQAELAIAIAEIVSRWELALATHEPERAVRRNLTMGPKSGVRVRVLGRRDGMERATAHP